MNTESIAAVSVYYAGKEKCSPGHCYGPHVRSYYLIHVILSGKGIFKTDQNTYSLAQGDAFLIRPGQTTVYYADCDAPWEYAWVAFDGYEVKGILENTSFFQGQDILHIDRQAKAFSAICELSDCFSMENQTNDFVIQALLYTFFSQIYHASPKSEALSTALYERRYYERAVHFILHNCQHAITVKEVALHVGIDRTYLYKLFRKFEACSPKRFLTELQLKKALNMLKDGSCSVTDVAYLCGFSDTSAFCNFFKKRIGQSPAVYQKRLRSARGNAAEQNTVPKGSHKTTYT